MAIDPDRPVAGLLGHNRELARAIAPARAGPALSADTSTGFWGEDGFSFGDLLDIVNPLHHLPVLATVYRALTGDAIAPAARIFGGALFGGQLGLAGAIVDTIVKEASGKSIGEHALALIVDPKGTTAETARTVSERTAATTTREPSPVNTASTATVAPEETSRTGTGPAVPEEDVAPWLSRLPAAHAPVAPPAGERASEDTYVWILDAMEIAFDRYAQAGGSRAKGARIDARL